MNIGLDAKRIFFNHSGLGNYSRRFYRALASNLKDDSFFLYSPRKISPDNPYFTEVIHENSMIKSPAGKIAGLFGGSVWRSGLVAGQLSSDSIDIYYGLSNEIPFGTRNSGTIKIVIIHDLIFLRYPALYPAIDRAFYKKKTRYACKYSDRIIAASEQTKQDIVDFYNIPGDKISVIFPGTDPSFYADSCLDSGGFFSTPRKYIISIGAITPRKNLLNTVKAFNTIKDRYDLDLVVIGTATGLGKEYLKEISGYIVENDLSERIHFLGNVPYKFVPDLCRKAQLLAYPSQFEGFGMPIVEALFSRIPVITTRGGCFPEAGGDAAIYTDPDSIDELAGAMEKIMHSPELRKDLISKGLAHAARFKQVNIEKDILGFHNMVISESVPQ